MPPPKTMIRTMTNSVIPAAPMPIGERQPSLFLIHHILRTQPALADRICHSLLVSRSLSQQGRIIDRPTNMYKGDHKKCHANGDMHRPPNRQHAPCHGQ